MQRFLPKGFTLIELLVSITIISTLVTLGVSAYNQSQKRQNIRAQIAAIVNELESAQKRAQVGDKDCEGILLGQQVILSTNTVTTTAICADNAGTAEVITLNNTSFTTNYTLTFLPLARGIDLGPGISTTNIDFSDQYGATHRLTLTKSGTIEYQGTL